MYNILSCIIVIMHYAMRDVKDMGQQMGYRSLKWNWPKEAMNIPIGAGIVDGLVWSLAGAGAAGSEEPLKRTT